MAPPTFKSGKSRWAERAKKADAPLSKLVIDIVENALADDIDIQSRGELLKSYQNFEKIIKRWPRSLIKKTSHWNNMKES